MSDSPAAGEAAKKRIVFLFSDTGGGHRSATEAMIEALDVEFPGVFQCDKIDFFREYYPAPLRYAPEIYPPMSRVPGAWILPYRATDGRSRTRTINQMVYPYVRRGARRLVRENPADLIVSVHPLVNHAIIRAMKGAPRRFMTVVTDMVSAHAFWYDYRADLVIVPTEEAKQRGIRYGVPEGNLRVVGLPVAQKYLHLPDRTQTRKRLGWDLDLPTILVVGGGDGMGPLEEVSEAINRAKLKAQLVVVCGRNEGLRERLNNFSWNLPAHIYGFTREMPDFMAAADILVTKAGPGTISEAFIAGLPVVLYSKVPGQEDGNVQFVLDHDAGVWAPTPDEVLLAVQKWVNRPAERAKAAAAARAVAKPHAARDIARIIADHVGVPVPGRADNE